MSEAGVALLDTNAVVAVLRNRPPVVRERLRRARADGRTIAVSSVVLYELWYGAVRSERPAENAERLRTFLAGDVGVLAFDDEHAVRAGTLRAQLEASGTPIGPYDLLIAAQALGAGATLVTANVAEFARVPGLTWENWAAENEARGGVPL